MSTLRFVFVGFEFESRPARAAVGASGPDKHARRTRKSSRDSSRRAPGCVGSLREKSISSLGIRRKVALGGRKFPRQRRQFGTRVSRHSSASNEALRLFAVDPHEATSDQPQPKPGKQFAPPTRVQSIFWPSIMRQVTFDEVHCGRASGGGVCIASEM